MRDYMELIERLMAGTYTIEELSIILPDAADVIEKLQKRVELEYQSGFADGQRAANRKKNKWISVEERLPKYGDCVLGIGPKKGYYVCDYRGISHFVYGGDEPWFAAKGKTVNITHWMQLPEPPKEAKA